MNVIRPSAHFEGHPIGTEMLRVIEEAGRTCYKSEGRMKEGTAEDFVRMLIRRGHESVLEHVSLRARFIVDRGVSHELVRHRVASYSMESSRFCNYSGERFGREITFIQPLWVSLEENNENDKERYRGQAQPDQSWLIAMEECERLYFRLLDLGWTAQQARSVLPNSLKTEVVMTANVREWRQVFRLRCSAAAHPQMREVMLPLLKEAHSICPVLFEDLCTHFFGKGDPG